MENNKLQKTNGDNGFPVLEAGIPESLECEVLTDDQAIELLKRESGIVRMPRNAISGLAGLGIYARTVGVLRTQRGQVMVTQAVLRNTLQILNERLIEEHARGSKARQSVIRGIAHEITVVSSVINNSVDVALDLEKAAAPTGKPDDIERPRNTGFGTGVVIAAPEVHIHEAKKELPTNGNGGLSADK